MKAIVIHESGDKTSLLPHSGSQKYFVSISGPPIMRGLLVDSMSVLKGKTGTLKIINQQGTIKVSKTLLSNG
jgi:hypothetical protein